MAGTYFHRQALHVENLLMDNIFVERLADKIVGKLGFVPGALAGGASKAGQPIPPKFPREFRTIA